MRATHWQIPSKILKVNGSDSRSVDVPSSALQISVIKFPSTHCLFSIKLCPGSPTSNPTFLIGQKSIFRIFILNIPIFFGELFIVGNVKDLAICRYFGHEAVKIAFSLRDCTETSALRP